MANKYTDAAFRSRTVKGIDKLVLWCLCNRARNVDDPEDELTYFCGSYICMKAGWCFPGGNLIKDDAGISLSTAKRAVARLIDVGMVTVVKRGGHSADKNVSNLYCVNYDALVASATVDADDAQEPESHYGSGELIFMSPPNPPVGPPRANELGAPVCPFCNVDLNQVFPGPDQNCDYCACPSCDYTWDERRTWQRGKKSMAD